MAKKSLTIADQINALETNLEIKNKELKAYEKGIDKLLKTLFGLDKKGIDKLIADSQKKATNKAIEILATDGVDEEFFEENSSSEGR